MKCNILLNGTHGHLLLGFRFQQAFNRKQSAENMDLIHAADEVGEEVVGAISAGKASSRSPLSRPTCGPEAIRGAWSRRRRVTCGSTSSGHGGARRSIDG